MIPYVSPDLEAVRSRAKRFYQLELKFHAILKMQEKLTTIQDQLKSKETYSESSHNDLVETYFSIQDEIQQTYAIIPGLLSMIDNAIEVRKKIPQFEPPPIEEMRDKFNNFILVQVPSVKTPYPYLCGSIQYPLELILPPNIFCATKRDDDWIVAYNLGYIPEKQKYSMCDASPEDDTPNVFDVDIFNAYPFPTTIPSRRTKYSEYSTGTKVMSLWPQDGVWTSVLYPATVIEPPSNFKQGYYVLRFDGETLNLEIPEQFIVKANL